MGHKRLQFLYLLIKLAYNDVELNCRCDVIDSYCKLVWTDTKDWKNRAVHYGKCILE